MNVRNDKDIIETVRSGMYDLVGFVLLLFPGAGFPTSFGSKLLLKLPNSTRSTFLLSMTPEDEVNWDVLDVVPTLLVGGVASCTAFEEVF